MKLYYWNKAPNFGDQLNAVLWPALLGDLLRDSGKTLFVGIGTLLNQEIPKGVRKVVFGTGAGYGEPPEIDETFEILCVRGPYTAKALGLAESAAVTDGALLARKIDWEAREISAKTIMIPHWQSASFADWPEICEEAGVHYTDPRGTPETVIGAIRSASLVITESLHGAILADAFRVPWIPVTMYHQIDRRKWADWAMTHELEYEPVCLPGPYNAYFASPANCEHYKELSRGRLALARKALFRLERLGWCSKQKKLRRELVRELAGVAKSGKSFLSSEQRSGELYRELERRLEEFVGRSARVGSMGGAAARAFEN
jgi:succinoglycan biosynthesis protein ExoV